MYIEYLIKWKGLLEDEQSWQPESIVQEYPHSKLTIICCNFEGKILWNGMVVMKVGNRWENEGINEGN